MYSIKDLEKTTGLPDHYIRKCLNQLPDIFQPHLQKWDNNSYQVNSSWLLIFQQISELKKENLTLPEIRQNLKNSGVNTTKTESVKPTQTDEIKNLYQELYQEKKERLQIEQDLYKFKTSLKILTGSDTPEEIEKIQQTQREQEQINQQEKIQLAITLSILETCPVYRPFKRKKLIQKIKELTCG